MLRAICSADNMLPNLIKYIIIMLSVDREVIRMKIREVMKILNARLICGGEHLDVDVKTACSSDMMSDVLAFSKEHTVLLTGLINPQVLRTADMLDIRCVVFVRGKQPSDELKELAGEYDIVLLSTDLTLYIASGTLYMSGLRAE